MCNTKNIDSYIFHISPNKEVVHEQKFIIRFWANALISIDTVCIRKLFREAIASALFLAQ